MWLAKWLRVYYVWCRSLFNDNMTPVAAAVVVVPGKTDVLFEVDLWEASISFILFYVVIE